MTHAEIMRLKKELADSPPGGPAPLITQGVTDLIAAYGRMRAGFKKADEDRKRFKEWWEKEMEK